MDFNVLNGLKGLEIAGPSEIFSGQGLVPIYQRLVFVDDFSHPRPMAWRGRNLIAGQNFIYPGMKAPGYQFIGDATDLTGLAPGAYDIVLGSHVLEHIANPIKALLAWNEVLREGGKMLQVIPHFDGTFDRHRPLTTLEHIISDFERGTTEDDSTHYAEIRSRSTESHSTEWFLDAAQHRGAHHHVFDTYLAWQLFRHLGMVVLHLQPLMPHHIVILCEKPTANSASAIGPGELIRILSKSPFVRDRLRAESLLK